MNKIEEKRVEIMHKHNDLWAGSQRKEECPYDVPNSLTDYIGRAMQEYAEWWHELQMGRISV